MHFENILNVDNENTENNETIVYFMIQSLYKELTVKIPWRNRRYKQNFKKYQNSREE